MAKRNKRLGKGIESLKNEIEKHFLRLEEDIDEGNIEGGRYHFKELDKSLVFALERKLEILGFDDDLAKDFRVRLKKLDERLKG